MRRMLVGLAAMLTVSAAGPVFAVDMTEEIQEEEQPGSEIEIEGGDGVGLPVVMGVAVLGRVHDRHGGHVDAPERRVVAAPIGGVFAVGIVLCDVDFGLAEFAEQRR